MKKKKLTQKTSPSATGIQRIWRILTDHGLNAGLCGFFSWSLFFTPSTGSNPLDYAYNSSLSGLLMLSAWFAQLAGAWLKRFPLQQRLGEPVKEKVSEDDEDKSSLHPVIAPKQSQITFYLVMHPIISGLLFAMGFSNLFPNLMSASDSNHWWTIPWIILLIAAALAPGIFTYRAMIPVGTSKPRFKWMNNSNTEYLADQLLIFSCIILFASIFGMPAMMQGIKPVNPQSITEWLLTIIFLVPLLWFGLMLFFIPFRILLIIEELGTWKNRLSSLLAVSPVIIKYIIG